MKTVETIEKLKIDMIADLIRLLRIPSTLDETQSDMPFGLGINLALKEAINMSKALGFRTYIDPDGYYGYAEIGEGKGLIGILGHLDVVPEGDPNNWAFPPYDAVIDKDRIYARGAQDDKGPVIAALYAMKALVEMKVPLNRRIRMIFGTDEETLWRGIKKYIKEQEIPHFGFTPDAAFPVIYAEKGLLQVRLKSKKASTFNLVGGSTLNAVAESAYYVGDQLTKLERVLKQKGYDYETDAEGLVVIGRSAHASKPYLGINAIVRAAMALDEIGLKSDATDFLVDKISFATSGEMIFGDCSDADSGQLTVNVGTVDIGKHGQQIGLDLRIPVTVSKNFIVEGLKRVAEKYNLEYEEIDYLRPVYIDKSHFIVKALTEVYEEVTGLDGTPLAIGGATYARAMDNIVAYGALFPGRKKVEHQPNEYIEIDVLMKSAEIYTKALMKCLEMKI